MYSNVYLVGPNRRGAWAQGKTKEGTQQGFDRSSQKTLSDRRPASVGYWQARQAGLPRQARAGGRAGGKRGRPTSVGAAGKSGRAGGIHC